MKTQLIKTQNKQEILEFNKRVHNLLGYKLTSFDSDFYFVEHPDTKELRELNFNRQYLEDWNCIMEVKQAIEAIKIKGQLIYSVYIRRVTCEIIITTLYASNTSNRMPRIYEVADGSREATVKAINQFLIWHEQNK